MRNNMSVRMILNFFTRNTILGILIGAILVLIINRYYNNNSSYGYTLKQIGHYNNLTDEMETYTTENTQIFSSDVHQKISEITKCTDRSMVTSVKQRGDFWVLYNYVKAEEKFSCYESITLTTQGDYRYLDNLIPLVDRWRGPVSVALHAPGYDFQQTVDSIAYLRNCENPLIKKYVTFHIFFGSKYIPKKYKIPLTKLYNDSYNCQDGPPFEDVSFKDMFKTKMNLTYPINVARNIARETAQTYFVFPSDIELYPTRNLIDKFLTMIAENQLLVKISVPRVYALPVFEIPEDQDVPENKSQLQNMYKNNKAFLFHSKLCAHCHAVPNGDEWIRTPETDGLDIFSVGKRLGRYKSWEAFYIGTHKEPLFDERMTWEGQSNKMTQGYALCLLNYDYMVLNNAFLTHKPGIKKKKVQMQKYSYLVSQTNKMIREFIREEIEIIYGKREGCKL